MLGSLRAERMNDFERALCMVDEAAEIMPLGPEERVRRAVILLRMQRTQDAHRAFDALRQEFKGSDNPDRQYLRHYCTAMLSLMQPSSGQWAYESKQAKAIKCSWSLKAWFPLITVDEIHDRIKPRR
jgi:hypothetical protein